MTDRVETPSPAFRELPLEQIAESPWNPRKHFDAAALEELAESIREKSVIEPIVVRPLTNGHAGTFEIVAGARRFRASKLAGRDTIPALVRVLDDVAALELAVIENGQRADVNPMEEAEGYHALIRAGKGYTPASIARKTGKSESFVVRRLKLFGLEDPLKDALRTGALSLRHAEGLLRLTPAQRKDATDPNRGVVWQRSPLFDAGTKWVPTADDLCPISDLEAFIRNKSHFDPNAKDAAHLTPAFAEQLELHAPVGDVAGPTEPAGDDEADEVAAASLLELTFDSMARMRMGAKPTDPIPLTPSKWKEIKGDKGRCEFARRGVVTQGTQRYGEILTVCATKRCRKHWPVKKARPGRAAPKTSAPRQESWQEQQARRERENAAREAYNKAVLTLARPKIAAHTAKTKFSVALVRHVLYPDVIAHVEKNFGVALTEATAAQVLLLAEIDTNTWSLDGFRRDCKHLKFDLTPIERQVKAAQGVAAKAKAKPAKQKGGRA